MNAPQFNSGAVCNKEITITYNGKTAQATVVDQVRKLTGWWLSAH